MRASECSKSTFEGGFFLFFSLINILTVVFFLLFSLINILKVVFFLLFSLINILKVVWLLCEPSRIPGGLQLPQALAEKMLTATRFLDIRICSILILDAVPTQAAH